MSTKRGAGLQQDFRCVVVYQRPDAFFPDLGTRADFSLKECAQQHGGIVQCSLIRIEVPPRTHQPRVLLCRLENAARSDIVEHLASRSLEAPVITLVPPLESRLP